MQSNISQIERPYDPVRDVFFIPDGCVLPPHQKTYWAALRGLGSRHYELSVCRPSGLDREKRNYDAPMQVKTRTEAEIQQAEEDSLKRSVRRARQRVRWLVKCIEADHMLTFSYRENVTDENKLKADLKETVRLIRTRYPDFQYVAVREYQERGALHLHMAVKGKQPIKWILHCWLKAIGQDSSQLVDWYIHDIPLAEKSKGAVNVRAPSRHWGGKGNTWKSDKLSGYLTKYIHKDFENSAKGAKRYWHTRGIEPIKCIKFWLGATSFIDALREARDAVVEQGIVEMKIWADEDIGNIWISATAPQFHSGRFVRPCPF